MRLPLTRFMIAASLAALLSGCAGEPPTGAVISANQDTFRSVVVNSKRPVLVEFWSESCVPCKELEPHLARLAEQHRDLLVVKVNSEENQPLAEDLGVRMVPTLFVYKDGEAVRTKIGPPTPAELGELVSRYVASK